ncbi:hypothetical protein AB6A40_006559 [Gnathostoma spinigerum]|uniref:Uncharacterized protein n=1 Tax=Gnathostoma spinigerum TaxID=75299 RepID=A0ABD6EIQ0_9BILA
MDNGRWRNYLQQSRQKISQLESEVEKWKKLDHIREIDLCKCRTLLDLRQQSLKLMVSHQKCSTEVMEFLEEKSNSLKNYIDTKYALCNSTGGELSVDARVLHDRVLKAEEEAKVLRQKLTEVEEARDDLEKKDAILHEKLNEISAIQERRDKLLSEKLTPPSRRQRRKERRETRFNVDTSNHATPQSRFAQAFFMPVSISRGDKGGNYQEMNEAELMEELVRTSKQLSFMEHQYLESEMTVSSLKQVIVDRDETINRYEKGESKNVIALSEKLVILEQENKAQQSQIKESTAKMEKLQKKLSSMKEELELKHNQLAELEKANGTLVDELHTARAEKAQADRALMNEFDKTDRLTAQLEGLRVRVAFQKEREDGKSIEKKGGVARELGDESELLEKEEATRQAIIKCSIVEEANNNLRQKLSDQANQLQHTEALVKELSEAQRSHETIVAIKNQEIERLEVELTNVRSKAKNELNLINAKLCESLQDNENLTLKYSVLSEAVLSLTNHRQARRRSSLVSEVQELSRYTEYVKKIEEENKKLILQCKEMSSDLRRTKHENEQHRLKQRATRVRSKKSKGERAKCGTENKGSE